MAVEDHLAALEARIEGHHQELKQLRGHVYSRDRKEKSREDAPGETNEGEPSPPVPARGPALTSEHLARRFRIGG